MPTTRKRIARIGKVSINSHVVELFREWKELDNRRGSGKTREGVLLTEDEQKRYSSLSREIESLVILEKKRPWDGSSVCYPMWGRTEHPTPESIKDHFPVHGWDEKWERAVKMRLQLEEMVAAQ